jgi:DNA (cytosine-5)-methyltransferase 1
MRYLSVCSGIEAASVAWGPLGWEPVAFAEIDAFPSAVLAHHYPTVPNYGDVTRFCDWPDATVDVLVGGTPCQSFSVAGLRKGLADPRGNLALTYLAILHRYRPRWCVWENVPGVLSADKGHALGALLGGLGQLG